MGQPINISFPETDPPSGLPTQALEAIGPTVNARIGFDRNYAGAGIPSLPTSTYPMLIDTGATVSVIDLFTGVNLHLPVIGNDPLDVTVPGGPTQALVFAAQVYIPTLNYTFYGRFLGIKLRPRFKHFGLLGRDFLRYWHLSYDGRTGQVTLER